MEVTMEELEKVETEAVTLKKRGKNMFKGSKFWLIVLGPILLLGLVGNIMMIAEGDVNYFMNPSNETLTVALISVTDGKDYAFEVDPSSHKRVATKKDEYHLSVENQDGEILRTIESLDLNSKEDDIRYIDLLGDHVYFVIDISSIYLEFYEDSDDTYLDELFDDETYKAVFYGEIPFYLNDKSNTLYYSLGDEIPVKIDDDITAILIIPFEKEKFESLTDDDLVMEAIDYVYKNLEKE